MNGEPDLLELLIEEVVMSLGVARAKPDPDAVKRLHAELDELLGRGSEH